MSAAPTLPEFDSLRRALEDCYCFQVNVEGRITLWISGAPASGQDLTGTSYANFFTERDQSRGWPGRILEWARSQPRCTDEGWRVGPDGHRFWAEHVISVIRGEDSEITGFTHLLFDADRRLAAERALREADRRILEYQGIARLGSYELDPASGQFLVTPEVLRIFALPHPVPGTAAETADFIPVPAAALLRDIAPFDVQRWYATQPAPEAARLTLRRGRQHIQVRTVAIADREGAVVRLMGTMQDITEIFQCEQS